MSKYKKEVAKAMEYLAKDPRVLFLGQTVEYGGSRFTKDLENLSKSKRIELPVTEEMQMGISTGLALQGYIPISIYPRFDFLLLAANQLVNHLDKMYEMSSGQFNPKVIVRTVVGSRHPFDPGPQHRQDHTNAFEHLLEHTYVKKLIKSEEIFEEYKQALERKGPSLLIEVGDLYL